MNEKSLSVILPVYNAATTLIPCIEQCLAVFPVHVADYEIIIVDDHSSDSTPTISNNLAAYYDPIMIIHQPRTRGYARSLLTGAMAARGDYVLVLDTNKTIHTSQVEHLLPHIGEYDIITGYPVQHPVRKLQQVRTSLIAKLLQIDLHTAECLFVLVRTPLFQQTVFSSRSSLIIPELYARAMYAGHTHIQIGIRPQTPSHALAGTGYAQRHAPSLPEIMQVRDQLSKTYMPQDTRTVWLQRLFLTAGLAAALRKVWQRQGRRQSRGKKAP